MIEAAEQGTITWDYDALGRLTEETFSDPDFADLLFTHDLAGHRKRQQRDTDGDGLFEATDETTDYVYDANDRLLEERVDLNGDGDFIDAGEKVTIYGYGPNDSGTQQTSKQVYEASVLKSLTTNSYDYQGRLNSVTVHTYDTAGHVTRRETTTYVYDATGIRVSSRQETDADGDGSGTATITTTTYLSDPQNHTGYAQTLEEVTKDGNGVETKRIVYTIGHDQISQTVYEGTDPPVTHTFHADGHGSTRILTDLAGVILQHYAFDAYGNALGFDPAQALTSYLYSGESFDARIGQTYLRARWYDATTGRFNRLDPFFGNAQDPQSLHKYLYVHGDPVNGVDPSGEFSVTIAGLTINISVGTFLATSAASYVFGKAFSAGYLLATEQSLKNFRWLEWSDLASFVPGGVVAGAFAKVTVLPVSLLAKTAGGKIVGQYLSKGGPAVAAAFRQTFARFGSKFTMRAADGTEVILEEGTEKIGFVHILQRHLAQFWDGTKVNKTTFFPTGTTQTDMLIMLKEAVEKANPAIIRSVRNLSGPMGQSVTLANGLTVKLVTLYKDGVFKVVTFFPEAGPGVTKAIDVVNLVT